MVPETDGEYGPRAYWERRLSNDFSLRGVGYAGFSVRYNEYLYRQKVLALQTALERYDISLTGKAVLDVGCGTGFFIELYSGWGAKAVTGWDITETSVRESRKRYPHCRIEKVDIAAPLATTERFDIVNVFDVMYHIMDDDFFAQGLRNTTHLVRPGGYLFLTDRLGGEDSRAAEHVRFRSLKRYTDILTDSQMILLDFVPVFWAMNRRYGSIPVRVIDALAFILHRIDLWALRYIQDNGNNLKLLVARKSKGL